MTESPMVRPNLSQGPDPAYVQVRNYLAEQIAQGVLQDGSRLMPERRLATELGVSRVTVRRSLQELVSEGILTPSHGRGWYVTSAAVAEVDTEPPGFSDTGLDDATAASFRSLSADTVSASPAQAKALGVRNGSTLLALERMRLLEGEPVAVTTSWLPLRRFRSLRDADLGAGSLYALLEPLGVRPSRLEIGVQAETMEATTAKLLGVKTGSAALVVSQTSYDEDEVAFELGRTLWRADRFTFSSTLHRFAGKRRAGGRDR